MRELILRKSRESARIAEEFFGVEADRIAACAVATAERLQRGGRVLAFGNGGSACDAQHIAVEFQHPIHEKRRAFPAMALPNDVALLTAIGNDRDFAQIYADSIRLFGTPVDIAIGISTSGQSANIARGLQAAREVGCLTIAFAGCDGGRLAAAADHVFIVPTWSVHRIQEVHVTLLHLLWDLVHISLGERDVV
ncbi:MAG: SIS domain-containing protein [Deltaproteobacteria bacterium]|nr:SIS domain-containing protein [Deltaproteobacteria bacterium]